jgi:prepilin-type N-terminal cleavage/methylation domain-containing protein
MDDHRASSPGQQHGFTLIELVVTITLLGIVLASTALLGRHAVDMIRNTPRVADQAIRIQDYAYLIRRMDEIAVLLSWSDTTLCYLDGQGKRRELNFTRYSWSSGDIRYRIAIEPSSTSCPVIRLKLWITPETTTMDTLLVTRMVPVRLP